MIPVVAAPAQQVRQTAAGQQERTKDQCVASNYPLELGRRHVQRPLDRGQGHVHDAEVQLEDELRRADQGHHQTDRPRTCHALGRGRCVRAGHNSNPRPMVVGW
jgi:hypothetical protein